MDFHSAQPQAPGTGFEPASDAAAAPKLVADVNTWVGDVEGRLNTMLADLQKVSADRTQLVADLTAQANA